MLLFWIGKEIGGNDRRAKSRSCASELRLRSHDIEKKKKKPSYYRVCCNVHCKVHWIAYEQSYKTSNLTALTYVTVRSDITLQYTMQHVLNFFRLLAVFFFGNRFSLAFFGFVKLFSKFIRFI